MSSDAPPTVDTLDPGERKLSSPPPIHPLPPSVLSDSYHPHESSPLLRPPRSANLPPTFPDDDDEWAPPHRSTWYLILLTLVMAGIQISWSVELAYISPYLLSLGLPKSTLSLVWVAGPVSGVIVQPLIGMMSDRSTFKWGRRRIFIILATLLVVAGFIGMGRTKDIVRWWTGRRNWEEIRNAVIVLAVASLIILDLAINAATAAARALIVDCVSTAQQNTANAWAGRMIGVGNVVGYLSGYINLPRYLPSLGQTQFQILCVLAPISIIITMFITCTAIKEADPALLFVFPEDPDTEKKTGIQEALMLVTSISRLPPRVRRICNIQFFAWIGWFLFLIWNTTYTGEIYVRTYLRNHLPPPTRHDEDQLWDTATRIASFALLLESFTSLFANLVLPLLIRGRFAIRGVTLRRLWITSHLLFAGLMWSTLFIASIEAAVAMVAAAGISWALTLWAPFALIAQCVSHINDVSRRESIASSRTGTPDLRPADVEPARVGTGITVSNPDERRMSTPTLPSEQYRTLREVANPAVEKKDEITSAGTILGLHNVFISSPQFISTLLASVIFHFLGAGGRGDDIRGAPDTGGQGGLLWALGEQVMEVDGGGSIGWVLRIGGLGGIYAAYLTWCLAEEEDALLPGVEY